MNLCLIGKVPVSSSTAKVSIAACSKISVTSNGMCLDIAKIQVAIVWEDITLVGNEGVQRLGLDIFALALAGFPRADSITLMVVG